MGNVACFLPGRAKGLSALLYVTVQQMLWVLVGIIVVAHWLRFCATVREVVGLIPDGVIGIFH